MQQKYLYEYAVLRVVPVVEREEFVNAGVILFSKKEKYLKAMVVLPEEKLRLLNPDADLEEIKKNLDAFNMIAAGKKEGGSVACLDEAERFRWLTAVRSASIQTSRPHPGVCDNLEDAINKLFQEMVG
ncbi:MAG: DUF3037 domain-containing protein [Bacteroidota bacterium]